MLKPFTMENAINHIKANTCLFSTNSILHCQEIGDGNMNYIFRIQDQEKLGNSYIVKQALPFMRSVGPSWPLTAERIKVEYDALKKLHTICPNAVPETYYFNEEHSLFLMQDLSSLETLRQGLTEQKSFDYLPQRLGEFLAKVFFDTSEYGTNTRERQELKKTFLNVPMCQISEEFIFSYPFRNHGMNRFHPDLLNDVQNIWDDRSLQKEVAYLKNQFRTTKQCLIHGDLHTGSLMVSEQDMFIIDTEFACYGPIGFDIGLFIGHVLLNYCVQIQNKCYAYGEYELEMLRSVWHEFQYVFQSLTNQSDHRKLFTSIFQDSLGFAGCEMLRRVIGTSGVEEIENISKRGRNKGW
ncbi:S-methyl-5-thioribose kinase [Radiobacillus deserti]|uniref:S-methyl-5-thioribose kinase n=1 Tax=Radiobacillus deserti TaxID=2594883 RepID=A0A516KJ18_9BACI|nr:S-methyl-5-thioribose kinase [Radiobacillus deserti]QDP41346.1 S-methyl-5-thioribose kinase [Radiobacillus deserti]